MEITLPLTGGCQCGAVRYQVDTEPQTLICCHCTECQKQSSSAFGMSLYVFADSFRISLGKTKVWSRPTDRENRVDCHFCEACGTRVYHQGTDRPEIVSIKAGSLDDRSWLRPAGNLWTRSAQPWVSIPGDALNYETQPDEFETLAGHWRRSPESG